MSVSDQNPYGAGNVDVLGSNKYVDNKVYAHSELPKECPHCQTRIKVSRKFKKSKSAMRLTVIAYASFPILAIISVVFQILFLHIVSIWLTMIPAGMTFSSILRTVNRWPKLVDLNCRKCNWSDSYLLK